jgi:transcriptional regulator with XRE-family HTH domain
MGRNKKFEAVEGIEHDKVARRLVLTRAALGGLTQTEFARRAGLKGNAYNQYETATNRPSIEAADALCRTYNLTMDWIYRGDKSGLADRLSTALHALIDQQSDA